MNVWIINHHAVLPTQGGGTRHYHFARELTKYGHKVTVICAAPFIKDGHKSRTKKIGVWEEGAIRFFFIPTPPYKGIVKRLWNNLRFSYSVWEKFRNTADGKPDVIIGSTIHPFAAFAGERLAAHYCIPFCLEIRDLWPQTLIDMKAISKNNPLAFIFWKIEKHLIKKSSQVITVFPYANDYLEKYRLKCDSIVYIPNGIDLDLFKTPKLIDKERIPITVMYLGAHGPANGLDTLLEAASGLSKNPPSQLIKWRFIGEGNQKERLIEKAKMLKLSNVQFENSVSKNDVPSLLQEADILVFHLIKLDVFKYGISPNKLFDYAASQRPIVFACNARNNFVLEEKAGISVPPENSEDMANAIRKLVSMSVQKRNELGLSGRQYVEKNHNFFVLGKKLNETLIKAIEGKQQK
jgi:glycosyltransferase involved in cell wall biosynthesis